MTSLDQADLHSVPFRESPCAAEISHAQHRYQDVDVGNWRSNPSTTQRTCRYRVLRRECEESKLLQAITNGAVVRYVTYEDEKGVSHNRLIDSLVVWTKKKKSQTERQEGFSRLVFFSLVITPRSLGGLTWEYQ